MTRFTVVLSFQRRARLLPIALIGALLVAGLALTSGGRVNAEERTVTYSPVTGGRHVYLTATNYDADEALTACGPGYHMASLWEILDVSNVVYDHDHPDAHVQSDSGEGPPSGWNGWIRTGRNSSGSATAGIGNCLAWTSTDSGHQGTAVRLISAWETPPGEISTWDAGAYACSLPGPVWCVGDFYALYLPVVMRNHS